MTSCERSTVACEKVMSKFFIVLVLWSLVFPEVGNCLNEALFYKRKGRYLPGCVIQAENTNSEFECSLYCSIEKACLSVNYKHTGDDEGLCELNDKALSDHPEDGIAMPEFSHLDVIEPVTIGTYQKPGSSCFDILNQTRGKFLPNQDYWIDIDNGGPMKVFCDMKTNGGGWTLVTNMVLSDSIGFSWSLATDYRKISEYNSNKLVLSVSALESLRQEMPFTQLMFYCHKEIPGRTFHIVTKPNSRGEDVLRYFTGRTNILPEACDSFTPLPDDNSTLAKECSKWGYESGKYSVGKWHYDGFRIADRLIDHVAFTCAKSHWVISAGRWDCDDWNRSIGDYAVRAGDFWKIFVR